MNRLYAAAALVAIVAGLWLYHSSVVKERDAQKLRADVAEQSLGQEKELTKKQNEALAEANVRANKHLQANQEIENETKKLRACIADKSCGVVVRFKTVYVPATPGLPATPTEPNANGSTCGYGSDFEEWYINLLDGIKHNRQQVIALQDELLATRKPGYCEVSKQ